MLSHLLATLLSVLQPQEIKIPSYQPLEWQDEKLFQAPTEEDLQVEKVLQTYLQTLKGDGSIVDRQGVWVQSDWIPLAQHHGNTRFSAASLTKIATSLASVHTWGVNYHFDTNVYYKGVIKKGVLFGDLIVEGNGDPLFIWEEGIRLGYDLQKIGLKEVKGRLILTQRFYMNFESKPNLTGEYLKTSFNHNEWNKNITNQYNTMKNKPPKPNLKISGGILYQQSTPLGLPTLIRHRSLPLHTILREMNIYSNNNIAEALAQNMGGGDKVAYLASYLAQVPSDQISLINGSGLGRENQISPRAVCQMFKILEDQLISQNMTIDDLFPVGGVDHRGTMEKRNLPPGVAVKTGTLNQVSALAGRIPTKEHGVVWFAIINSGWDVPKFRKRQDEVLQNWSHLWNLQKPTIKASYPYYGDPKRNQSN